jgi:hypothetical protein
MCGGRPTPGPFSCLLGGSVAGHLVLRGQVHIQVSQRAHLPVSTTTKNQHTWLHVWFDFREVGVGYAAPTVDAKSQACVQAQSAAGHTTDWLLCGLQGGHRHRLLTWLSDRLRSSGAHSSRLSGCPAAVGEQQTSITCWLRRQLAGNLARLAHVAPAHVVKTRLQLKAFALLAFHRPRPYS